MPTKAGRGEKLQSVPACSALLQPRVMFLRARSCPADKKNCGRARRCGRSCAKGKGGLAGSSSASFSGSGVLQALSKAVSEQEPWQAEGGCAARMIWREGSACEALRDQIQVASSALPSRAPPCPSLLTLLASLAFIPFHHS